MSPKSIALIKKLLLKEIQRLSLHANMHSKMGLQADFAKAAHQASQELQAALEELTDLTKREIL